jgi:hypothetical protein
VKKKTEARLSAMEQQQSTTAAAGGGGTAGGINREQMKKMSEADKEMELRANRAKALLAERHVGLKAGQVRIAINVFFLFNSSRIMMCSHFASPDRATHIMYFEYVLTFLHPFHKTTHTGSPPQEEDGVGNENGPGRTI